MRSKIVKTLAVSAAALGLGLILARAAAPSTAQGIITGKAFLEIGAGTTVADLTSNPKFPDNPDAVEYLPYFEWNPDPSGDIFVAADNEYANNYGLQMVGFFYPPATGDYVFWISADDGANLYLSTDATAANKKLIAQEQGWSDPRMWDTTGGGSGTIEAKNSMTFPGTEWPTKDTANGGAKITLTAGRPYYIEALMKEGGGGDNLAVAVQSPDFSIDQTLPIPGQYLSSDRSSGPAKIVKQPESQAVVEGDSVTFRVEADGLPPYTFQWQKNNVDIADATQATLTLTAVTMADNNASFTCKVSNAEGSATSSAATVTISSDTAPPTLAQVSADTTFVTVNVTYSEPVSDTAINKANYAMDQGVTISAVTRVDEDTVSLTTSQLTGGLTYTLTINGVQDTAVKPNTIAANTTVEVRPFVYVAGMVVRQKYDGVDDTTGNTIAGLFDDPRFPGAPDRVDLLNSFEYPANAATRDAVADPARNYFDAIEGFFIPPTTGNYVFFISFADRGWLYLSTDESPANKHQILALQGWNDPRQWLTSHDFDTTLNRTDTATSNEWPDAPTISLQAGKKYYMLLVHHDASWAGGDWVSATYKLETEEDPEGGSAPRLTGDVIGTYVDPSGASITFTTQPQSATIELQKTVTLQAAATGTSLYGGTVAYQWQSAPKGSSTWTDIAGATSASYTTPVLTAADDGKQYRVLGSVPGYSQASSVATLSVVTDVAAPVPTAAALPSNTGNTVDVGVSFNEAVDAASAGLQANYSLSKGTLQSVTYYPKSTSALLKVSGLNPGDAAVVTVKNVADSIGNKISSADAPFTVSSKMKWGVVGGNEVGLGNYVIPVGADGFDVYSDGIAEWASYDEAVLVFEEITGDFDKKVRVEYQDASSQWARAGLIARDVTNFGVDRTRQEGGEAGRYQKVHVNPTGATMTGPGTAGNNAWEGNQRLETGAATTSAGGGGVPQYPNAWCRLQRQGDTFTIYRSDDGANWTQLGTSTFTGTTPAKLYVGIDYSPENGNVTEEASRAVWVAKFRQYGDTFGAVAPTIGVAKSATGITVTFTGSLESADAVTGPWTAVSGPSPVTVPTTGSGKFYRAKQ